MEYSKRISDITERMMDGLEVDMVLGMGKVLYGYDSFRSDVKITWRDRIRYRYALVKNYFSFLWEAITNSHECNENDY